jgi:hypothetical protein
LTRSGVRAAFPRRVTRGRPAYLQVARRVAPTLLAGLAAITPVRAADSAFDLRDLDGHDSIEALRIDLAAMRARLQALERALAAQAATTQRPPAADATVRDQVRPGTSPDEPQSPSVSAADPSTFVPPPRFDDDAAAEPRPLSRPVREADRGRLILGDDGATTLRLGGFLKVDAITDFTPIGTRDWFVPSTIATHAMPAAQRGPHFGVSSRATRFNLQWRRETSAGPIVLFMESNFFGRDVDNFVSGAPTVNPGLVYAQFGDWTVGRAFSLWMDIDAYPDTLDFYGPNAAPFAFNAQIRRVHALDADRGVLAWSIENPRTQLACGAGAVGCGPRDRAPDLVGRWRREGAWGHTQLAAVVRHLAAGDALGQTDAATGGAVHLSGSWKLVPDADYLVGGLIAGRGVGRYVNDLSYAGGHDSSVGPDGRIALAQHAGGHFGLTHFWSARHRSTWSVGVLNNESLVGQPDRTPVHSTYWSANWVWAPSAPIALGAEVLYGSVRTRAAGDGDALRLMLSAQYRFTP